MVKYPFAEDRKQRVLHIDLGMLSLPDRQVPLVATTERDRITLYWGLKSGLWGSWTREHARLDPYPVRPDSVGTINWSRNVAIAAGKEFVLLAYRRHFGTDTSRNLARRLALDAFSWDEANERLVPVNSNPTAVPLDALGLTLPGIDLWAHVYKDKVYILTHAWHIAEDAPFLELLTLQPDDLSSARIENAQNWRAQHVNKGGYDFHARLSGEVVFVVHREDAAAAFASTSGIDVAQSFAMLMVDDDAPAIGSAMKHPNLVLNSINLESGEMALVEAAIPGGEHPRIQNFDPLILTANRYRTCVVDVEVDDRNTQVRQRNVDAGKVVLKKVEGTWASARIGAVSGVAYCLRDLLGSLPMLAFDKVRMEIATLLDALPMELVRYVGDSRRPTHRISLLHHDDDLGALVVSEFELRERGPGEMDANAQGSGVWDINHAQIGRLEIEADPSENTQFAPHGQSVRWRHVDGFFVNSGAFYSNTIGGRVVVHPQRRGRFVGYVDMGDGGLRVFHESEVEIPRRRCPRARRRRCRPWRCRGRAPAARGSLSTRPISFRRAFPVIARRTTIF